MSNQSRRERIESMLRETPEDDGFLRYGLGMEYKAEGDLENAVRCFRDLLQATPDYVAGYMQLGQLLNQLEREDEAKAIYRDGIAIARRKGDKHAADEMSGFLALLD